MKECLPNSKYVKTYIFLRFYSLILVSNKYIYYRTYGQTYKRICTVNIMDLPLRVMYAINVKTMKIKNFS